MNIIKKEDSLQKEKISGQEFIHPHWYIRVFQIIRLVTLCLPFLALPFLTLFSFIIVILAFLGVLHPLFNLAGILLIWCLRQWGFLLRRSTNHLLPEESKFVSVIDKLSTKK